MKSRLFLFIGLLFVIGQIQAQSYNDLAGQTGSRVITTAVPFLMIAPDARHGAMGDAGVATSPDANSMHWNAAKYAFIENDFGFGVSYSPWLRKLVNDISLAYVSGYVRLNDLSTIAFTLRYFSLGDITFTNLALSWALTARMNLRLTELIPGNSVSISQALWQPVSYILT